MSDAPTMAGRTASAAGCVADPGAIADHAYAVQTGRADPVGRLQSCLARIDAVEERVRGFCLLDRDGAMAAAERLRAEAMAGKPRGPLHGLPVAIKDVIDVEGLPTRAGSATRANIAPSAGDATVVARLRAAGAVILGKAHTTEFAYFEGPPPTRNPFDLARTPGGSSSGPAAVVASGMVPLSLGTQTAGSVNRPAAYCGIAAFKPSTLSWPGFGVVPFAPSFDTVGVFGYRTADATAAARLLMPPFMPPSQAVHGRVSVAVPEDAILDAASGAVRQTMHEAAHRLAEAGIEVRRRPSPVPFADVIALHRTVSEYELARAHGGLRAARVGEVTPALLEAIARGAAVTPDDYAGALRALDAARVAFWAGFAASEILLSPAAPDVAPLGMKTGDPRFIIPFTALGGPIVSMPIGFDAGLPLGLLLAGAPGTDRALADRADELSSLIETRR